jgi:HSP20 family protein
MTETDDNLAIPAEVPGFTTNEVEIHVEPRWLMISGKLEAPEENKIGKTIHSERCAQEILRAVELPAEVDGFKASAILQDGILNSELPKAAHSKKVPNEPKAA